MTETKNIKKKSHRAGIRARICEESMIWHGFRLRRGDIFGKRGDVELVFTGKTRECRDGSTQALIFTHVHIWGWEANQEVFRDDWEPRWLDCADGIGKKFTAKYAEAQKNGILPGADRISDKPATSSHWFLTDKNRYDEAAKRSYYYDCMTERR